MVKVSLGNSKESERLEESFIIPYTYIYKTGRKHFLCICIGYSWYKLFWIEVNLYGGEVAHKGSDVDKPVRRGRCLWWRKGSYAGKPVSRFEVLAPGSVSGKCLFKGCVKVGSSVYSWEKNEYTLYILFIYIYTWCYKVLHTGTHAHRPVGGNFGNRP